MSWELLDASEAACCSCGRPAMCVYTAISTVGTDFDALGAEARRSNPYCGGCKELIEAGDLVGLWGDKWSTMIPQFVSHSYAMRHWYKPHRSWWQVLLGASVLAKIRARRL